VPECETGGVASVLDREMYAEAEAARLLGVPQVDAALLATRTRLTAVPLAG
jgi:hypothetical protein